MKKVSFVKFEGKGNNNEIFNNANNWEHSLKNKLAKDDIVIGTSDVIPVEEADYVIFMDNIYYKNLDVMWKLYNLNKLDNTIYIDYEPPTGHCKNHEKKGINHLSNIFKYVVTYNDDYIKDNIIKGNIADFYCHEINYKKDFNKRKLIAMFNNNTKNENIIGILNYYNSSDYFNEKNTKDHKNSNYFMRTKAAEFFYEKCPEEFDLYGTLWPDKFSKVLKGYIEPEKKYEIISKYKFIISFDSFVNQNGYISEKIFDCFKAKTIPIYMGASNIKDYIPENCFIDFNKFDSFDSLYNCLIKFTDSEYDKYIKNIEKYLKSDMYKNLFSSEASANILYNLINRDYSFSYKNALKSLKYFQKKKNKVLRRRKINFVMTNANGFDYVQLEFSVNDYFPNKNSRLEIFVDNKKCENIEVIKEKNVDNDYFRFVLDLYYKGKPILIMVKYVYDGGSQWLRLFDFSQSYSEIYGLKLKRNKTKIVLRYINMLKK